MHKVFNSHCMKRFTASLLALLMANHSSFMVSGANASSFEDEDSVHFQAPLRGTQESQDWVYLPDSGKFISPKGQVIEPWNQPKEIRELRQQGYGLDTLQSLLASSVLRINSMSNGELTLYLSGRLRGGMMRNRGQKNVHHCSRAPESDQHCWVHGNSLSAPNSSWTGNNPGTFSLIPTWSYNPQTGTSFRGGSGGSTRRSGGLRDHTPTDYSWLNAPPITQSMHGYVHTEPPYGFGLTEQERIQESNRKSQDTLARAKAIMESNRIDWDLLYRVEQAKKEEAQKRRVKKANKLVQSVIKDVLNHPNALLTEKAKTKDLIKAWKSKRGQKVKKTPYLYAINSKGHVGLFDTKRGIVYTAFIEDRQHTDCYLPPNYPKRTQDYPALDMDLGDWLLKRYTDYKLALNDTLIGGVGKVHKGPFYRVLSEPRHRTTKPMLATFGIVLNHLGPEGVYKLAQELSAQGVDFAGCVKSVSQYLYMFRKPEKYFTVSLEKPIAVFKGEPLSHENVPPSIVEHWKVNPHFTKNIKGDLAVQDSRNGLTYTTFVSDRRYSDAFLPVGYDYSDRDIQLGGWLIERYVDHKIGLHDVLIGNMEDRIHEIFSEPKHRTNTAILSTFGIVANKMGPSGLRKLSVELETSDRDLSRLLFEAHQWLGLFKNPNKYFKLSMEKPIAVFKGECLTHTNVPAHIRRQWWTHEGFETFTNSLAGTSSLQDPRNGLCYPLYSVNYRNPQAMIPRSYEPTDEHALMGATFLSAAGEGTLEILEKMLGIPSVYANTHGLQPGGMQQALTLYGGTAMVMGSEALKTLMKAHPYMAAVTTGLALDTMLNNGELTKVMTRLMQTATEEVWKAAKTAMDVASWVTKDQGFAGFDGDRMKKFITWVADEDKSKILATYGVERGVQILSTPKEEDAIALILNKDVPIAKDQAPHIFRDAPGHISEDNSENRQILIDNVIPENFINADRHGNEHYYSQTKRGQVWVELRNGEIRDGGINNPPLSQEEIQKVLIKK
jgi:hypothetical protein